MRRLLAIVTATMLLSASLVFSSDHVLDSTTVHARLTQAQQQREADSLAVGRVLASPEAAVAAKAMGSRPDRLQAGVAALSDQELHGLALRAEALRANPVAGFHDDAMVHDFLVIFLIVAMVAIVLNAAD